MGDKNIDRILKRIEKNGFAITKSGEITREISQKTDFVVYRNRKRKESTIVDKTKVKLF